MRRDHQTVATKARHAYGPTGHRGMSVLIFENLAVGYTEAERLHRHFVNQGTDMNARQVRKVRFVPGGKRQLFGFLGSKEDMEGFNKHCHGMCRYRCVRVCAGTFRYRVCLQLVDVNTDGLGDNR